MHSELVLVWIDKNVFICYNTNVRGEKSPIMISTKKRMKNYAKHHRCNRYVPADSAFWWQCQRKPELHQHELASAHGPVGQQQRFNQLVSGQLERN